MKFMLHYRGPLKSNGDLKHKQELRRHFYDQLKDLWDRSPLNAQKSTFLEPSYTETAIKDVKGINFASVVNSRNHLVAKLEILLLRPEEPGKLIAEGGDIDNRLKTLLDALSIPKENQLRENLGPAQDEQPFHCLLEDDNLVTSLSVTSDRLLGESEPKEVLLFIKVDVSPTFGTLAGTSHADLADSVVVSVG